MASFRKRGNTWQARIRRKGYSDAVRSFSSKLKAAQWVRHTEASMNCEAYQQEKSPFFTDILERYSNEVTILKRGVKREQESIRFMRRQPMAQLRVDILTPSVIANYRDQRLKTVSNGTILREISILSSVITHAIREWSLSIKNPCSLIRKPSAPEGRCRLLSTMEEEKLLAELLPIKRRSSQMIPIVQLALETAMRRGELLNLRWENIDIPSQTALLLTTKNGTRRNVPLSKRAISILESLPNARAGHVFTISYMTLNNCFVHARERAGINDFHFHDLRHTAITRLAEKLPNVIELAAVTGHRTVQTLKKYYHPNASALAKKLD